MININERLRQRSEKRRAQEMEYMSKQYAYSKDNVIYVGGVPLYKIADTSEGRWQVTPSEAEAVIAKMRQAFIEDGGERYNAIYVR